MKLIKSTYLRIKLNRGIIIKTASTVVGCVYTIWGCVSLFEPLEGLFCENITGWVKLGIGMGVLLIVALIAFIGSSIYYLCSECTHVLTSNSRKKVYVQFGDMYSPDIVEKGYSKRRNIVIPVNRCFDTIVDDNLVSHNTQHGKVMQELYDKGLYDSNILNDEIQASVSRISDFEQLSTNQKMLGNLKRYACGTVAEIKVSESLTYFFLGLSKFNERLKASTTKAEFAEAVQKMIEYCNERAQGYPVVLPLMGTGLSRTNIPAGEVLMYMVSAFRINRDIINCDFHIVVWTGLKDEISIKNL